VKEKEAESREEDIAKNITLDLVNHPLPLFATSLHKGRVREGIKI